ncbi:MAG: TonB-dependent receptor [Pseudomonadota bacterium]
MNRPNNIGKAKTRISCALAALVGTQLPIPASLAQTMLEEITVTAQKREQNLQDVPIAITAFTGAQLDALGVQESFDVANFTPGVHISGNLAGQNTQFTIRGVTQNDFNDIVEAPNAVYLDEGYIAVAQAQTFATFDIDRVEILKGPQSTLFGRNATGGVVQFISNKPSFDETSGHLDVTAGRYDVPNDADRYTVEGALGGPLTDNIAARVAFRYNYQDAYLQNRYPEDAFLPPPGDNAGQDIGDDDTRAGRVQFAFRPSDTVEIGVAANYAKTDVATGPYQSKSTIGVVAGGELVNVIDTPPDETRLSIDGDQDGGGDAIDGDAFLPGAGIGLEGRSTPGGDFFGYLDPDGDDFEFSGDFAFDDQGETETYGGMVRVDWDIGSGYNFTSISDYKDYQKLLFIDVDAAPVNQLANFGGVDAWSFTQEFRINGETDRSRWVAGFYYLKIDNDSDNGLKAPLNSIAGGSTPVDIGTVAKLQTESYNVFGQIDYDIASDWTLTAGLRLIQEEKEYDFATGVFPSFNNFSGNQGNFIPDAFGAGSPYFFSDDTSDALWAGKLQLDWRYSDDTLIYAGINRGVKAASFNAPLLGAYLGSGGDESLPYDEEVLIAYEAGFKSTFGEDGDTRLNGAFYYYDYQDYQAFLFVGVGGVVINADAETYGAELELQTSPIDGLDLILAGSILKSRVEDVPLRFDSPLPPRDVEPNYTPERQVSAIARYTWPLFGGNMAIQGDMSYSSSFYYNLRNFSADQFDSYTLYNGLLSWSTADSNWTASLAVRNITDERAGIQGFDLAVLCGCNEVSYRSPRFYSVGLRYEF